MDERLLRILESAIRAPSADNRLSIRFAVSPGQIDVIATDSSFEPDRGYRYVLATLSLGAVAESMDIAARDGGFEPEIRLTGAFGAGDTLLQVTLSRADVGPEPLARFISARHTNRRPIYRGPSLSEHERGEIEATVARFQPGLSLAWLNEKELRRQAVRLIGAAETERFRNRALHAELFSAIRFDKGWHASCEEGLPPGALAVEPPLRPFFSVLRHWPVMRAANLLGMHRLLGLRSAALPCRIAPDLAVLAVETVNKAAVFAAGRAFMRIWLQITGMGRVLQPLPASALYALEGAEGEDVSVALQHRLRRGWTPILSERIPLMMIRLGKASVTKVLAGHPAPPYTVEDAPQNTPEASENAVEKFYRT